jgi:Flp pilus assembly protein TadG
MTTFRHGRRAPRRARRGQALVEFSLALIPFLVILMGIIDLGRGIYMSNGVTDAAREIARTTAVHLCDSSSCVLGNSAETAATIETQRRMIPNLSSSSATITFACTTVSDAVVASTADNPCSAPVGENRPTYIRVTVTVPYSALTPILSMVAPTTLSATAHVQVP